MRTRTGFGGLVVLTVAILAAVAQAQVNVGTKPNFAWRSVEGYPITPQALKGNIVVIDFWATWCTPCMAEAPHLVALNKEYAAKGVTLIGVSLDSSLGQMRQVARAKGLVWPQVCSGKGWHDPIAQAWGVRSIPHTFLLAPDGTVLWHGHPAGLDQPLAEAVKKYPTEALNPLQGMMVVQEAAKLAQAGEYEPALASVTRISAPVAGNAEVARSLHDLAERLRAQHDHREAIVKALASHPQAARLLHLTAEQLKPPVRPAEPTPAPAVATTRPATRPAAEKPVQESEDLLVMAQNLISTGNTQAARRYLERVVKEYPQSPEAAKAKKLLASLDNE